MAGMNEQPSGQPPPFKRQPPPIPANRLARRMPPPLPKPVTDESAKIPLWGKVFIGGSLLLGIVALGNVIVKSLGPASPPEVKENPYLQYPPPTNAQQRVEAPSYMTLIGDGLSGSGFHFEVDGRQYIACSLHQFDGAVPSLMVSLDIDEPIEVTGQVDEQLDVQVLTFNSDDLEALEPLSYEPGNRPKMSTPVYIYDFDDVYGGTIVDINWTTGRCEIRMDKPFPAMGNSGSPVISAIDGKVIGVLLDADDPEAARIVGFEYLNFSPN